MSNRLIGIGNSVASIDELYLFLTKEDLLYKTLRVQIDREYYCKKADLRFLEDVNLKRPKSMSEFETLWYNGSSRRGGVHYDSTRYHALNLQSVFSKGTIEFRMFNSTDGAMPSGNSVAAMVMQTLASLTGERSCQAAADRQLSFLSGEMGEYPSASCFGVLAMMGALYPHRELVCVSGDGMPGELKDHLKGHPADDLHLLLKAKENADVLSKCAPFTKEYPIPEQGAMYYLCENGACKAPVTDFAQLIL